MHTFGLVVFSFIAAIWVLYGIRGAYSAAKLPWIRDYEPGEDAARPGISLLFAARDEEEKLPASLLTLAALDYPDLEIIAVDDRSQDATGRILDDFASAHARFYALHVSQLPGGWLGKSHALQKAFEVSTGEWLLFTDADVVFRPDVLRRAMALAEQQNLDHLTLVCKVEMHGFWEKTLLTFFGLAFHLATDAHSVANPNSRAYVGIGAFQLLRRSAYEAIGTHRRLAMEVVDDMKLGKLVKEARFRSGVAKAWKEVRVRWHAGVGNIIRGTTKNFFASSGYNLGLVSFQLVMMLAACVAPWVALPFLRGLALGFDAIAVAMMIAIHAGVCVEVRASPVYALTEPIGAVIFCWMLARSTIVTLWNGGIEWRGTFYRLEELRKGVV